MSSLAKNYRVLLVDDQPLFRQGLRSVIDAHPGFLVIAEAGSVSEAADHVRLHHPDLVVMELRVGTDSGHKLVHQISQERPGTPIVVLSVVTDSHEVLRAIEGGVNGYLTKGASVAETLVALQEVVEGRSYLHHQVSQALFSRVRQPGRGLVLTARERDTLQGLCRGRSPQEIGRDLILSVATIKTYMRSLYRKLDVSTRSQLVLKAFEMELVAPTGRGSLPGENPAACMTGADPGDAQKRSENHPFG